MISDTFEERYEHHKAKKRKLEMEEESSGAKSTHLSNTMATSWYINILFTVFVFQHVVCDCGCYLLCILVLTKIVYKIPIWSNKVHDDGVVHLEWKHDHVDWESIHRNGTIYFTR